MKRFLILAAWCVALPAVAQFKSGNKLLQQMDGDFGDQMNAIGYVAGVADTLQGAVVCAPQSVTAGQLVDMTKVYLERTPARRHLAADVLIHDLLKAMWPCVKKGGGA